MKIEENANLSTSASMQDGTAQKCAPAKNKFRPIKAIINFWIDTVTFLTLLMHSLRGDSQVSPSW